MEPCYDYLEINTFDIWQYERQCFLVSKTDQEHMQKLTSKIQNKIYSHYENKKPISVSKPNKIVEPFTRRVIQESVVYKDNFSRYINEWNKRVNEGLRVLVSLDYFLIKDCFFEYNYDIIVDAKEEDFKYWFCLKLVQYQLNTDKLTDFLEYQFKLNFNEDLKKFKVFLKFSFIQQENVLFTQKFVETILEWTKGLRSDKQKETPKTYYLDIVRNQPNILNSNSFFQELFFELKKNKYVSDDTKYDQFLLIFKNNQLKQEEKIKWTGTMKQLKKFIESFCKQDICSLIEGIEKWKVATYCFQRKFKGNWVDITECKIISESSGSIESTIEIEKIGELITQIK